jgi:hypothetical protein
VRSDRTESCVEQEPKGNSSLKAEGSGKRGRVSWLQQQVGVGLVGRGQRQRDGHRQRHTPLDNKEEYDRIDCWVLVATVRFAGCTCDLAIGYMYNCNFTGEKISKGKIEWASDSLYYPTCATLGGEIAHCSR